MPGSLAQRVLHSGGSSRPLGLSERDFVTSKSSLGVCFFFGQQPRGKPVFILGGPSERRRNACVDGQNWCGAVKLEKRYLVGGVEHWRPDWSLYLYLSLSQAWDIS